MVQNQMIVIILGSARYIGIFAFPFKLNASFVNIEVTKQTHKFQRLVFLPAILVQILLLTTNNSNQPDHLRTPHESGLVEGLLEHDRYL
jgi:hypothetical protein